MNKQTITSIIIIILAAVGLYFVMTYQAPVVIESTPENSVVDESMGKLPDGSQYAPQSSAIIGTKWIWEKTIMNDGTIRSPRKPGVFSITFGFDGRLSGTTDCNGFGGDYTLGSDGIISFGPFMSTMMYCEGSQESMFTKDVTESTRIMLDQNGNVVLLLNYDSGSVIFIKG